MIHYKKGDLLEAEEDIIAHGCNCAGGFGSGVAGQIAKHFPRARDAYLSKFQNEGWALGEIQPVTIPWSGYVVINCATQEQYLPRGIQHADYAGIEHAMSKVKEYAKDNRFSVAIPKIGAGLAGGDWAVIEKILEKVFSDYDVTIYQI